MIDDVMNVFKPTRISKQGAKSENCKEVKFLSARSQRGGNHSSCHFFSECLHFCFIFDSPLRTMQSLFRAFNCQCVATKPTFLSSKNLYDFYEIHEKICVKLHYVSTIESRPRSLSCVVMKKLCAI